MTEDQLYSLRDSKKSIGTQGEDFVLSYERQRLQSHPRLQEVAIYGRQDIGLGYDIRSFEGLTSATLDRYIEVKTYTGQPHFFLSQGEWAAARKHAEHYYIYLIDYSQLATPNYEPIIIRDPANTLSTNDNWSENIQQREYSLAPEEPAPLPEDFDTSTILIGCFKDNYHRNWIQSTCCYNVRQDIAMKASIPGSIPGIPGSIASSSSAIPGAIPGAVPGSIPGAIPADEIGMGVRYLLLYNICSPRSYRMYSIKGARLATNAEMRSMAYPNPRCPAYVLYKISGIIDNLPGIDIMSALRTNNDKVIRTSGTPIFMTGKDLRKYFIDTTASRMTGTAPPKRVFTNEGKPWTKNQSMRLEVFASMHKSIAEIAQEMKRTPAEIHAQLKLLGLE